MSKPQKHVRRYGSEISHSYIDTPQGVWTIVQWDIDQ